MVKRRRTSKKKSKFILYKSLVPKIRYLRAAYEPTNSFLIETVYSTLSTTQVQPLSFIRFSINTIENRYNANPIMGYQLRIAHAQPNIQGTQIAGSTSTADLTHKLDVTATPSTLNTAVELKEGSSDDSFVFMRGMGVDQISQHYKKYFVQRKKVVFSMQQMSSDMHQIGVIGDDGVGDNDLPGFTMYHRILNDDELALTDGHGTAERLSINQYTPIHQASHIHAKHYPWIDGYVHSRNIHWNASFKTLAAQSNVELDELTGTCDATNTHSVTFPITHNSPTEFVYGEIGWIPDALGPLSAGNDQLRFIVQMKVIYDIIYFDDDDVYVPQTEYDD